MIEKITEKLLEINYVSLAGKLLSAVLILVIGLWIIKMLLKGIKIVLIKRDLDKSLQGFLMSLLGWGLKTFLFIVVVGELGIETTSFAAVIAAASLAVGMALQGSLSNFAGGVLIMIFKPFRAGDFIDAQGQKGVVKRIEIFTTTLNTVDNKEVIIPNGILSNGIVTNYSSEENRRVDITFGVSYDADIKQTKDILLGVLKENNLVLKKPVPSVHLIKLNDSSVDYEVRAWVKGVDYWIVYCDIMERTKMALDKAGIEIPYPHTVEIHKV